MKVTLKPYHLKLKHPFTISRDSYSVQPSLIVQLTEGEVSGFGEASSNTYYGATLDKMSAHILNKQDLIAALKGKTPEVFWDTLFPEFKHDMFALCALDMAYNDLYTKQLKMPLYKYWGLTTNHNPLTNYTIGIDTIDVMVAKLKELPWPIYKIKLGTKDDLKIIRELRKHTNAVFRVDANCGWTVEETIANSKVLKTLGVEFIEQPLKANDWEGHKQVYLKSKLPIIADESCQVEADVQKCRNHFHGVNVKLVKCGGLTPAKRMLEDARTKGLKTMVGCMTESSVGISAIAHLLPLLDYVDMDGALLLKEDIATGVTITEGVAAYAKEFGTGVTLL